MGSTVDNRVRCAWCEGGDAAYVAYHDNEWGVPTHEDRTLFEFLILEGAQAGLSWATILKRREGYRRAFAQFDPEAVARFGPDDVAELLQDTGIIRNRLKVNGAVKNARQFLRVQEEFGSFDAYVWRFVEGQPLINSWKSMQEVPVTTPESDALSKDLKKRGFTFVGSTIMYAYMQACGLVMDHTTDCYLYRALAT